MKIDDDKNIELNNTYRNVFVTKTHCKQHSLKVCWGLETKVPRLVSFLWANQPAPDALQSKKQTRTIRYLRYKISWTESLEVVSKIRNIAILLKPFVWKWLANLARVFSGYKNLLGFILFSFWHTTMLVIMFHYVFKWPHYPQVPIKDWQSLICFWSVNPLSSSLGLWPVYIIIFSLFLFHLAPFPFYEPQSILRHQISYIILCALKFKGLLLTMLEKRGKIMFVDRGCIQ